MKAIVWQADKSFELADVPKSNPGPGQVLVQVEAASICSTDFHYDDFDCTPPIVPGHEVAGTVVTLGQEVSSVEVGDKVTLDPVQRCGKCRSCKQEIPHLCLNTRHLGNTDIPGGWAEYVAIDAANVYKIPDNVSFTAAALTEPVAVCLESFKRANFESGQTVLILGDGVFGFLHAMLARILKAKEIIVAGHYDKRLNRIAEKTSAVICNTHNQQLSKIIAKTVGDQNIDLAIEATGAAVVPNIGLQSLRPRGTLVLFSYVWKPEILNLGLISMKELNVLGSCRSLDCFERCLQMVSNGQLDIQALIDIKVPLEEFESAFQQLRENKANVFKAVLLPK